MVTRRGLITTGGAALALGGLGYGLWPNLNAYTDQMQQLRQTLGTNPDLTELIRYATLAANSHNTQPWHFRINDNRISILPDLTRRTAVVDPDDHHLYISLGCATENLLLAAAAHGRPGTVEISADGIDVALGTGAPVSSPLYDAIPLRQSTRAPYDSQPIATDDIQSLQAAAAVDGVTTLLFTEPRQRDDILDFVIAGNTAQMDDPAFVAELRDWLRFSPAEALATGDGLFSACSGNPVTPAWLGRTMFSLVFNVDIENDKYRDHVRSSAGIAVFTGDRADPAHWINVGRSFQRFALQATALGIRTAHINQPIEVPALRGEFASWLGSPDARPDLVIRFGRAAPLPMSARRPVSAIVTT